jgi:tRNA (cmo5U34)-methyltransferase
LNLVGVDDSGAMLQKAKEKFEKVGVNRNIELVCQDLDAGLKIENASVVVMNLTLQFIRPLRREILMKNIADGVREGGCLLLVEKVLADEPDTSRHFIKHYYDFKQRNGYSQMEISQKREALENILIPYKTKENEELVLKAGFTHCEIFFKWYNFCGYVVRKVSHMK